MNHPVILFDGICNLCNDFVQFVVRHDKKNKFRFGSLQSDAAKKLLEPFHFPLEELKTIVLVEDGKIYLRSRAVLRIASQLDGAWKLTVILYIFPSFISDAFYNLISKFRYKFFGKRDSCMVPTPELKSRFIEEFV
jgi:predicted DCC family thiol-disulfide oxidoreductase YuxK